MGIISDCWRAVNLRDPERIERICSKLEEAWTKVPDWRLGQLLENIFGCQGREACIFHVEDDVTEAEIDEMLRLLNRDRSD